MNPISAPDALVYIMVSVSAVDSEMRETEMLRIGNIVKTLPVFAHYGPDRLVEAAKACRDHDIAVMMGAPNLIRGGSHSGNVAADDLATSDLLDIVSSDYVPSALLLSAFHLAHILRWLLKRHSCLSNRV